MIFKVSYIGPWYHRYIPKHAEKTKNIAGGAWSNDINSHALDLNNTEYSDVITNMVSNYIL